MSDFRDEILWSLQEGLGQAIEAAILLGGILSGLAIGAGVFFAVGWFIWWLMT